MLNMFRVLRISGVVIFDTVSLTFFGPSKIR